MAWNIPHKYKHRQHVEFEIKTYLKKNEKNNIF